MSEQWPSPPVVAGLIIIINNNNWNLYIFNWTLYIFKWFRSFFWFLWFSSISSDVAAGSGSFSAAGSGAPDPEPRSPRRRRPATTGDDRRRPATTGDDRRRLKIMFGHIKYDEKYMPELFLTPPEFQNKQNQEFLTIFKKKKEDRIFWTYWFFITCLEFSKDHFPPKI